MVLRIVAVIVMALLLALAYVERPVPAGGLNGEYCWLVVNKRQWVSAVEFVACLVQLAIMMICFVLLQKPSYKSTHPIEENLIEYALMDDEKELPREGEDDGEGDEDHDSEREEEDAGIDDSSTERSEENTSASRKTVSDVSYRDLLFVRLEMLATAVRVGMVLWNLAARSRSGIFAQVRLGSRRCSCCMSAFTLDRGFRLPSSTPS